MNEYLHWYEYMDRSARLVPWTVSLHSNVIKIKDFHWRCCKIYKKGNNTFKWN